jgi:hypothetical protein
VSSFERTRWHLLIDGPQIQVIGVESQNCLARLSQIVPDVSLAHFVVTVKNDGSSSSQVPLDVEIEVAIGFVEESERGSRPTSCVE